MIKEVLRRIEVTKVEKLHYLDLKGLELQEIPKELLDVSWIGALSLSENNISDISLLSQMTNLHKLALTGNKLEDISVLEGLSKLRFIFLANNLITDISILKSQERLKKLVIHSNQLSFLPNLSHFPLMAYLDVSNNPLMCPSLEDMQKMLPLLKIYKC
ncbi:leucine-rich repeat domain-containing protein [Sulfurimonas sp. SAG-AH-194-L11]|nr:leucine-rich repeat domain-containing protein [Sulfurimonas sp. SAG-AH-194-L11]MDF1877608.1 leucine-rich repeat domain-containing protein [Sulfurimonas sp. SAG-AH-194-L11]